MAYQFTQDYKQVFKDQPYTAIVEDQAPQESPLVVQEPQPAQVTDTIGDAMNTKAKIASQMMDAQREQDLQTQSELSNIIQLYRSQGLEPSPEESASAQTTFQAPFDGGVQRGILGRSGVITQQFGNRNAIEKYSKGINYGTDIAVPKGTPVALPPGEWKVTEAFSGATASGSNNKQGGINRGYGNSIFVQNIQTGERLRMSHLSQVGVQPGQVIKGGQVIARTGATGNVHGTTGEHLDIEYYTPQGKIADVLKSRYAQYLMSKAGQSTNGGGGNPMETIKNGIFSFQQDYQNFMKTQQASLPNALDRAITSPKTALEAFAPGMRDSSKQTFDAIKPFNIPVGSILHSQLFADDNERLARSQAQSGQPLTQEQKKMAISKMVDTIGSVTGSPKFHPDDVKFLNETADILGDNARIAEQPKAMKDLQALADVYLTPKEAAGKTETVLKKLLNKTEPLIQEAQKYKTADEFIQAQNNLPEYAMSHRPTEGVRAFDLTEKVDGEQMIPKDMYEQWYGSRGTKADLESIAALKKAKGNPEANVTIYRASPKESFNNGDLVTFSKDYAQQHAQSHPGSKVYAKTVKAKDVRWAMDDINEFGYYPSDRIQHLTDIFNRAKKK